MIREIPNSIKGIKRRKIRYVLFRMKSEYMEGAEPLNPKDVGLTPGQVKAIKDFYITNESSIEGFEKDWDIGIDDIDTMVNRREKYWLFGISKFIIVQRAKEFLIESGEMGVAFMFSKGLAKEVGENKYDYDYNKILQSCPGRASWD